MKKVFLSILFLALFALNGSAQKQYRNFALDAGVLVGEIFDSNAGVAFPYLEPKFNLTNKISLGLRLEYVLFDKKGFEGEKSNPYLSNLKGEGDIGSVSITTDYYFTTNKVRPFVGGGLGVYSISTRQSNEFVKPKEKYFAGGSTLRAGLQFNRLRFAGELNLIPSKNVDVNYFSIKMGFVFGGDKKKFW